MIKIAKSVGKILALCVALPLIWFATSFVLSLIMMIPMVILGIEPTEKNVALLIYISMAISAVLVLVYLFTQSRKNGGDVFAAAMTGLLLLVSLSSS